MEDVGEGEEVQIQEELGEEVEILTELLHPGQPTKKQVEEHRTRGHMPFRSWCRWCCLGRGRSMQHHAKEGSVIPIVGLDYFFLTEAGVQLKNEMNMDEGSIEAARSSG